jgi:transposase-like protein
LPIHRAQTAAQKVSWDLGAAKLLFVGSDFSQTDVEITVEEVARRFGVAPSTLHGYLPAARQTVQDEA